MSYCRSCTRSSSSQRKWPIDFQTNKCFKTGVSHKVAQFTAGLTTELWLLTSTRWSKIVSEKVHCCWLFVNSVAGNCKQGHLPHGLAAHILCRWMLISLMDVFLLLWSRGKLSITYSYSISLFNNLLPFRKRSHCERLGWCCQDPACGFESARSVGHKALSSI